MGKVSSNSKKNKALAAKRKAKAQIESKQRVAVFVPLRKPILCSSAKTTFFLLYENQFLFCTHK
jgi:hypothetical protein